MPLSLMSSLLGIRITNLSQSQKVSYRKRFPSTMFNHLINEAVFHRLLRGHEIIALRIALDYLQRLASALRKDAVQALFGL